MTTSVMPSISVQVAWGKNPLTPPTLASDWSEIGDYIYSGDIDDGKQHEMEQFPSGEGTLKGDNRDRVFDPTYASGPWYPNVKLHRRVRIVASHADLNKSGLTFDGTTGKYALKSAFVNFPATELTFEALVICATSGNGTLVSYATSGNMDRFTVKTLQSLTVIINGTSFNTGINATMFDPLLTHVVVQWRSREGLLRVFVNGMLRYEATGKATGASIPGGGTLVLGQQQTSLGGGFSSGTAFLGQMREARLWSAVRSPHALYATRWRALAGSETSLVSYWKMDDAAGTNVNDYQTSSNNDLTLTGGGWTTVNGDRCIATRWIESIKPSYPNQADAEVDIKLFDLIGLLSLYRTLTSPFQKTAIDTVPYLLWPLDELIGKATDLSGNARVGTYPIGSQRQSECPWPIGDSGYCVGLNPGEQVTADDTTVAKFERTDAFSVICLVRFGGDPTKTASQQVSLVSDISPADPNLTGWELGLTGNCIFFTLVNAPATYIGMKGFRDIIDGTWHFLAVTYDGSSAPGGISIYSRGILVPMASYGASSLAATIKSTYNQLRIGATESQTGDFVQMRYVGIWNRVLTAAEIKSMADVAVGNPWPSQRSDQRVSKLLDFGKINTVDRDLRKGNATLGPVGDQVGNILQAVQDTADLELSGVYCNEYGAIVLDDRYSFCYDTVLGPTFGEVEESYDSLDLSYDNVGLGNTVITQRSSGTGIDTDGPVFINTDTSAQDDLAPISYSVIGEFSDDRQPYDIGPYVLSIVKTPGVSFDNVGFVYADNFDDLLGIGINRTRVTVNHRPTDTHGNSTGTFTQTCVAENRKITFNSAPREFDVQIGLIPDLSTRSDYAVIGKSALDGTAVLA